MPGWLRHGGERRSELGRDRLVVSAVGRREAGAGCESARPAIAALDIQRTDYASPDAIRAAQEECRLDAALGRQSSDSPGRYRANQEAARTTSPDTCRQEASTPQRTFGLGTKDKTARGLAGNAKRRGDGK